jgi:hypothetical protein
MSTERCDHPLTQRVGKCTQSLAVGLAACDDVSHRDGNGNMNRGFDRSEQVERAGRCNRPQNRLGARCSRMKGRLSGCNGILCCFHSCGCRVGDGSGTLLGRPGFVGCVVESLFCQNERTRLNSRGLIDVVAMAV